MWIELVGFAFCSERFFLISLAEGSCLTSLQPIRIRAWAFPVWPAKCAFYRGEFVIWQRVLIIMWDYGWVVRTFVETDLAPSACNWLLQKWLCKIRMPLIFIIRCARSLLASVC